MSKRKRSQGAKSKHWCFTLNNPTDEDEPDLTKLTYIIVGREVSEAGTKHLQGYCVFKWRTYLSGAKKVFPRAHLEIKKGTFEQAITYCKKDGDWKEWGTVPVTEKQRQKDVWTNAFNLASSGRIDEIPSSMRIRYYHSFKRIQQDYPVPVAHLEGTCGQWFIAPTGYGKSYLARKMYPDLFDKPLNKWWDGYRGQDVVLLDDVDMCHNVWIGYFLKRWADRYSFPAEQKGTTIQIRPKILVVTSQYTIEELFGGDLNLKDALLRRFTVKHVKKYKK